MGVLRRKLSLHSPDIIQLLTGVDTFWTSLASDAKALKVHWHNETKRLALETEQADLEHMFCLSPHSFINESASLEDSLHYEAFWGCEFTMSHQAAVQ